MGWLHEFGAEILYAAGTLGIFVGSGVLAMKIFERWKPDPSENETVVIGCTLWIVIAVIAFAVFGPALNVLKSFACRSAGDFEYCMDPPDRDWM